jgi:hypothetical protein
MILPCELDHQLRLAYPTETTQDVYLLELALSWSWHEHPLDLPHLQWSIHELTCSWNAFEAENDFVYAIVYESFNYRPCANMTLLLTLPACDTARVRLHLLVHLLGTDVPPRCCRYLFDFLRFLQPNLLQPTNHVEPVVSPCGI